MAEPRVFFEREVIAKIFLHDFREGVRFARSHATKTRGKLVPPASTLMTSFFHLRRTNGSGGFSFPARLEKRVQRDVVLNSQRAPDRRAVGARETQGAGHLAHRPAQERVGNEEHQQADVLVAMPLDDVRAFFEKTTSRRRSPARCRRTCATSFFR
jgi:hypothetical protein